MNTFTPLTREQGLARRKNSVVIGIVLFTMVTLFYVVTIVKLQGNIAKRKGMKTTGSQQTGQLVSSSIDKIKSSKSAQGN